MGKIPTSKLKSCPKFNSNDDPRIFHTNLRRNLIWHDIYPRVKAHETQLRESELRQKFYVSLWRDLRHRSPFQNWEDSGSFRDCSYSTLSFIKGNSW